MTSNFHGLADLKDGYHFALPSVGSTKNMNLTATIVTNTGKKIELVWNTFQSLDPRFFDFQLYFEYTTTDANIHITDIILYAPITLTNGDRFSGNICIGSENFLVSDMVVNTIHSVGSAPLSVVVDNNTHHAHTIELCDFTRTTDINGANVQLPLYKEGTGNQSLSLSTDVYTYPRNVPWSLTSMAYSNSSSFDEKKVNYSWDGDLIFSSEDVTLLQAKNI